MVLIHSHSTAMATPSSTVEVLRRHYDKLLDLLNALSDPVTIASKLFSNRIITDRTLQKVLVAGQADFEKNQTILEAVRFTVKTKPGRLLDFISVLTALDQTDITDVLVSQMRSELSESPMTI